MHGIGIGTVKFRTDNLSNAFFILPIQNPNI